MNTIVLNGAHMTTRGDAHAELARALSFPPHYGANLDALWDLVTSMSANVTLSECAAMLNALGVYGCKLLQLLFEAAAENPYLCFRIES